MNKLHYSLDSNESHVDMNKYDTNEMHKTDPRYFGIIIEVLKHDVGTGLISADIWKVNNAKLVASFNSQPKAVTLFDRTTKYLSCTLRHSEFSLTDGYYTINLANQTTIIQIPMGEYQLGMHVDTKIVATGVVQNVTLPKIMKLFKETLGNKSSYRETLY